MAGPPIFLDQFGLGPRNATFRVAEPAEPPPLRRDPLRKTPKAPRTPRFRPRQVLAWAAGLGGYAGLVLVAHGSPHADLLYAAAVVWLMVSGALNAHFIVSDR
jgi:hypothetical protein